MLKVTNKDTSDVWEGSGGVSGIYFFCWFYAKFTVPCGQIPIQS